MHSKTAIARQSYQPSSPSKAAIPTRSSYQDVHSNQVLACRSVSCLRTGRQYLHMHVCQSTLQSHTHATCHTPSAQRSARASAASAGPCYLHVHVGAQPSFEESVAVVEQVMSRDGGGNVWALRPVHHVNTTRQLRRLPLTRGAALLFYCVRKGKGGEISGLRVLFTCVPRNERMGQDGKTNKVSHVLLGRYK